MSRDVPSGWRVVRLGQVARESRTRNSDKVIGADRLVGVFKTEGMTPTRERVKGSSVERCKIVSPGAFAYNPMRLNIGSIARWEGTNDAIVSPDYVVFEPDQTLVDGKFLDFLRLSPLWTGFTSSAGDGGVRVRIYFDDLARFSFALPPLHEQRRIAEILSSVDEAIQATEAVIQQTRTVRVGTLEALLKRSNHTRVPLGEVLASSTYGLNTPLSAEPIGTPVLRMGNIQDSEIALDGLKFALLDEATRKKYDIRTGDLLFNRTNSRELVGKVAIARTDLDVSFASYIIRLRTSDRCNPFYAHLVLSSPIYQDHLRSIATPGASQANINATKLSQVVVPLPSLDEQDDIVESVTGLFKAERQMSDFQERLTATKRGLMSDLLTGRKRVTETVALAAE